MELIGLNAEIRENKGKGSARVLRREGRIPAVLYGPKSEPVTLSVSSQDLLKAEKDSKTVQVFLDLTLGGSGDKRPALLKELQLDPVSREYLHADFYEIDMNKKINVMVPVVTVGKSVGVEYGGLLQVIRRELEISCLPLDVPEKIEVDVTDLAMGASIHVDDISVGENLEIVRDVNFTVITCLVPKGTALEEEEAEEEVEAEAEAEA